MVKKIELYDREISFSCKIFINNKLKCINENKNSHIFYLEKLPAHCKIEINPYKIKPMIRVDDCLVNYGLAKIIPWDHMLEFTIHENFLNEYFEQIVESKRIYLKTDREDVEKIMGINNKNYYELIEKIENNIK